MKRILVVGNGLAAHRLTARLAALGHEGPVTVLGAEPHPAYQRTLLGSVLGGGVPASALTLSAPPPEVEVRTGVRVVAIDRPRRMVRCADGTRYGYDTLVLATGARPTGDVHTLADAARPVRGRVAVVGGGVLGVETATALRRRGHRVVLAHGGPYPMHRHLDEVAGQLVAARLESWGIELRMGAYVPASDGSGASGTSGAAGTSGTSGTSGTAGTSGTSGTLGTSGALGALGADTVLRCTGTVPETAAAREAGLAVRHASGSIVVDDRLRTSDPAIRAIGACAGAPDLAGALAQAETLATLLTGGDARYAPVPQVLRPRVPGLDIASLGASVPSGGSDEVVTFSDPARGRYARLEIRDDRISRAVLVGLPEGIAAVTQLSDTGRPVPGDRLALLLGGRTKAPGDDPAAMADEAVLCHCNNVSKGTVVRAWQDGARELAALAATTRATTGCGGCTAAIRAVCASLPIPEEVA
ncbi:FAD-dependent oxidoreductase [Streptomyces sp. NPDC015346]|uniref:FAD-dependent oxidoreductase n=1 Tax=Streptomyces sp. NPDC015346 TaxID=3364954 RepID=UPI0036F509C3